jgi:hypothetical protein
LHNPLPRSHPQWFLAMATIAVEMLMGIIVRHESNLAEYLPSAKPPYIASITLT